MSPGIWQILLVLLLVLVLFGGRGKISSIMGDMAKGITSFRKGLKDEEPEKAESPAITDRGATIDAAAEKQPESNRAEG